MYKITKQSIDAFYNAKPFKKGNMEIKVLPNVTVMLLHDNEIAYRYNDPNKTLMITSAGWKTNVTRSRLNALKGVELFQKDFEWFLNGEIWNGDLIEVKQ